MFSLDDFQKLKAQLKPGSTGMGFAVNPQLSVSINDNTLLGGHWEVRISEDITPKKMCILTERDGQLAADYRLLVPRPNSDGYNFEPLADPEFERRAPILLVEIAAFLRRQSEAESEANDAAIKKLSARAGDEAAMQRWLALVTIVSDTTSAEKIAKSTARSFTAPESFVRRLGLSRVVEDLPWRLLINLLRKEKLLVEFDWREDVPELAAGLDKLCAKRKQPSPDWNSLAVVEPAAASDWLNAASTVLKARRLTLACFDTGDDGYSMALIALDEFEVAASHAAAFGWRLTDHFD